MYYSQKDFLKINNLKNFVYIKEIDFYEFDNLINKQKYLEYNKDFNLLDYDDLDEEILSEFVSVRFILKENIKEFFSGKKHLVLKVKDDLVKKLGYFSKNDFAKMVINLIQNNKIALDIDKRKIGIYPNRQLYNFEDFKYFLTKNKQVKYIIGHNIENYDKKILSNTSFLKNEIKDINFIDTLYLGLLLEKNKYLALKKEYKKDKEENDPIEDAKESFQLFKKELNIFKNLPEVIKLTYAYLLSEIDYYKGFFNFLNLTNKKEYENIAKKTIKRYLSIQNSDLLKEIIQNYKLELAFLLSSKITENPLKAYSIKNYNFAKIKKVVNKIQNVNIKDYVLNLKIDGFENFKEFSSLENENKIISQKDIIEAAIYNKSVLAVLPTGGGKSLCYQIPAIYDYENFKGLTVVVSPLRSLMKDQIENFNKKNLKVEAGALSSFLSPSERRELIDKVENGKIGLLYIAPEALRYKTIKNLLKNSFVTRFVIDEAHCISIWGHDFRPDYRYIAKFIKNELNPNIPISCFTATASKEVLKDIESYFKENLNIKFEKFIASNERKNLTYKVFKIKPKSFKKEDVEDAKYKKLLKILNNDMLPAIIYIPDSIDLCNKIAEKLLNDTNFRVAPFHSKIENKEKILEEYINNEIDIIVATTAFGMGVDKPDIKTVIHFNPSSSIEDYLQEAGRAGRDEKKVPNAECIVLYYEQDFDKKLQQLKNSIITKNEINSVYQALKKLATNNIVKKSALEIALKAKFDVDGDREYKNKINTILAELEDEGLIERKTNQTKIKSNSINVKNLEEAREKLGINEDLEDVSQEQQLQIEILKLILKKSRKQIAIDEIAYLLGKEKQEIINILNFFEEKGIISNDNQIKMEIKSFEKEYFEKEKKLIDYIENNLIDNKAVLKIKEIVNANSEDKHVVSLKNKISLYEKILRNWKTFDSDSFKLEITRLDKKFSIWSIKISDISKFKEYIIMMNKQAEKIHKFLLNTQKADKSLQDFYKKYGFSIRLKEIADKFKLKLKEVDKLLLYLHNTESIKLLEGTLIYYTPYEIYIKETKIRYTQEMYEKRKLPYYSNKRKKIHILNEFFKKQLKQEDTKEFLLQYFILSIDEFIKRFIKYTKRYIEAFVTKSKLDEIYKNLSNEQKEIIKSRANTIMILAGPGSGKTKTLVHKIANTLLNDERVNIDQFLMLTRTRTAALHFKERLYELIGSDAYKLDIFTFHGFANYISGKIGLEKNKDIINEVNRAVWLEFPLKTTLYLDEYQDIGEKTFNFVKKIVEKSEINNIVAVGDDDQIIMDFDKNDKANIKYFDKFWEELNKNKKNEKREFYLTTNYRSDKKIVELANKFIFQLKNRKKTLPLKANSNEEGEVKLIKNNSDYLYEIVLNLVKNSDIKNIAILAHTNDECLTLKALFEEHKMKSQFILDINRFNWSDLIEIYELDEEVRKLSNEDNQIFIKDFEKMYNKIKNKYKNSKNIDKLDKIKEYIMEKFEQYFEYNFWRSFLDDLDDEFFEEEIKNNIVISTIHKAKGKEFDYVILMDHRNENNQIFNDSLIRRYYVAMTRAKKRLFIVSNQSHFDRYFDKKDIYVDKEKYNKPKKLIIYMQLKNIHLGKSYGENIKKVNLKAGDKLDLFKWYLIKNNIVVAELSREFQNIISKYKQEYKISDITVDAIVNYFVPSEAKRMLQILCKIEFEAY